MNDINFQNIKGLLIDIDGTLLFKGKPIRGAIETISKLRNKDLKILFLTNTDSKTPNTIMRNLRENGFRVDISEIFTPIIALKEFLINFPDKKSYFVTTKEVENEFRNFPKLAGSEIPAFVIIGDFRDNWDVNRLNKAFNYILNGAALLGTQGNIYFINRDGDPMLDTGSFVKMLASATNGTPKIFGKPSAEFFLQALKRIRLQPYETIVIGDDIDSDIQGAINAGIRGILVKTGKGQFYKSSNQKNKPMLIIDDISKIFNYF